jgi:aspartate aminotransferase-like enzyme
MCGAFSDKWFDVSKRCGKEAEALQVPWGSPIRPEQVEARLATGQFDALTIIHNETSTGVMSRIYEIAALKKKFPDVMFIVDAVSSMSAVKLEVRRPGRRCAAGRHAKGVRAAPGPGRVSSAPRRRSPRRRPRPTAVIISTLSNSRRTPSRA